MSSNTKLFRVNVPLHFVIPSVYIEKGPKDVALALRLGADALTYVQKKGADAMRQETHAEVMEQATRDFEEVMRDAAKQQEAVVCKLKQEKQKAEEAMRVAQIRLEALEVGVSDIRSQLQKEMKESSSDLIAAKDEQIVRLQQALDKAMDGVGKRVESLQQSMTKTLSSSKEKGALGETFMEGHLKRAYDCDIQVVSKGSETADIRMNRTAGSYFWEIKNYSRIVSTEEVNKFRRDLRLHPDVKGGILVSLRQGIVGKSRGGDIDVEFLDDGRFILFMCNFMHHDDPVFYLQTLRPFFDTIETMTKPIKDEAEAIRTLETKAVLISNLLRSHAVSVTKHKNSLVGHKKRTDAMFTEFNSYVLEAEAQIQTVLRVAMGSEEATTEVLTETETFLPSFVFRKERLSDCVDDKMREYVKWLLTAYEVREGAQLEIKDLIEKAKKDGYSEKWVRGAREDIFQETAWAKGSRYIQGLVLKIESISLGV
jgi:hypothetical protein